MNKVEKENFYYQKFIHIINKQRNMYEFDRKILHYKNMIPGIIRRLLGLVFFLPTLVFSFVIAVLFMVPLVWLFTGKIGPGLDFVWKCRFAGHPYWHYIPLIRGTISLFYNRKYFWQDFCDAEILHSKEITCELERYLNMRKKARVFIDINKSNNCDG